LARAVERLLDCAAVTPSRGLPWWPAILIALLGLGVLYQDALRTGFLNDDYLFLEDVRDRPLSESLTRLGALANYYRPLSRQIYFSALAPLSDGSPWLFRAVNALLFAVALALLVDLLRALLPRPGVLAGALYFAALPLQRVNLIWISCSQDLLALIGVLAAVALFRRGRDRLACVAYLAALASKEVAFPLPLALAAWAWWPGAGGDASARSPRALARRMLPFVIIAAAWVAVLIAMRAPRAALLPLARLTPLDLPAAWVHEIQSLLGLEHPAGMVRALGRHAPALIPLVALAALAPWVGAPRVEGAREAGFPPARHTAAFAVLWLVAFGLPLVPVAHTWSAYYYTVAGVGAAVLVGLALRGIDRWGWVALTAVLLWVHAASSGIAAFAVADRPWGWTSHLTAYYLQRGAALIDTLGRQVRAYEPRPAPGTRFFFATLPPYAGFQMGNGPLLRALYRDTSLAGHFYSQFSEATAGDRPCRFLYWDGMRIQPLYGAAREPWFQVGSDLLLFGRPDGAAHAFHRGLTAGEALPDHLYWLGWAELWSGRRDQAEAAWQAFGARDDPPGYDDRMVAARDALLAGDSLAARRRLFEAIRLGIGRPEAHGALGELLEGEQLKYALLELKVAGFLNPRDLRARHHLIRGLVEVRLDDAAREALAALTADEPGWARDSLLTAAVRTMNERSPVSREVVKF
jgi:hypothetical protein